MNTFSGETSIETTNKVIGAYSGILAGEYNTTKYNYGVVLSGYRNTAYNFCGVLCGSNNKALGTKSSVICGQNNSTLGNNSSIPCGQNNFTYNDSELASGKYNKSTKNKYTYLATVFSIGNGKSTTVRHNAFEVKQNGDIYIPDTSTGVADYEAPMIHLQQKLIDLETTITNLEARIAALENK